MDTYKLHKERGLCEQVLLTKTWITKKSGLSLPISFFSFLFFGFGVLPTFVLCKVIICVLCRHLTMTPEPIFVMQMLMFLSS